MYLQVTYSRMQRELVYQSQGAKIPVLIAPGQIEAYDFGGFADVQLVRLVPEAKAVRLVVDAYAFSRIDDLTYWQKLEPGQYLQGCLIPSGVVYAVTEEGRFRVVSGPVQGVGAQESPSAR